MQTSQHQNCHLKASDPAGGGTVCGARLPACTDRLWASKSPSRGRQMDFDMEMASVQIDHLCHLNNQLSAW